jgi:hypothetical protein
MEKNGGKKIKSVKGINTQRRRIFFLRNDSPLSFDRH